MFVYALGTSNLKVKVWVASKLVNWVKPEKIEIIQDYSMVNKIDEQISSGGPATNFISIEKFYAILSEIIQAPSSCFINLRNFWVTDLVSSLSSPQVCISIVTKQY